MFTIVVGAMATTGPKILTSQQCLLTYKSSQKQFNVMLVIIAVKKLLWNAEIFIDIKVKYNSKVNHDEDFQIRYESINTSFMVSYWVQRLHLCVM